MLRSKLHMLPQGLLGCTNLSTMEASHARSPGQSEAPCACIDSNNNINSSAPRGQRHRVASQLVPSVNINWEPTGPVIWKNSSRNAHQFFPTARGTHDGRETPLARAPYLPRRNTPPALEATSLTEEESAPGIFLGIL